MVSIEKTLHVSWFTGGRNHPINISITLMFHRKSTFPEIELFFAIGVKNDFNNIFGLVTLF
jgi:hypothetical protein